MSQEQDEIQRMLKRFHLKLCYELCTDDETTAVVLAAIQEHEKKKRRFASKSTHEKLLAYDLARFVGLMPSETKAEKSARAHWKSGIVSKDTSLLYRVNLLMKLLGGPRLEQFGRYRGFGLRKTEQRTHYKGHLENLCQQLIALAERRLLAHDTIRPEPALLPISELPPEDEVLLPTRQNNFYINVFLTVPGGTDKNCSSNEPGCSHSSRTPNTTIKQKQIGLFNVLASEGATANVIKKRSGLRGVPRDSDQRLLELLFKKRDDLLNEATRNDKEDDDVDESLREEPRNGSVTYQRSEKRKMVKKELFSTVGGMDEANKKPNSSKNTEETNDGGTKSVVAPPGARVQTNKTKMRVNAKKSSVVCATGPGSTATLKK